jgi:hypothetical protein
VKPQPPPHDRGFVAVFISCQDRDNLDRLKAQEEARTGYPIKLKAILSKLIVDALRKRLKKPLDNY